ncbi:MAG TPA: hypothetical protein VHL11_20335 [Phototrophicaceae bacterium]|jgi:hypothetical protein|nr:hypothetical protein [Phototrophicaceae bacterium]
MAKLIHLTERQQKLFRGLLSLMDLYIVLLILFLPIKLLTGDYWTVVAIGNSVLTLGLIAVIVYLPFSLLLRRWKTAVASCIPTVFFVVVYEGSHL